MPKATDIKRHGLVYCLVNDSFPDQVKIGITQQTIDERMSQLYTTGVPTPFRCHCAKRVGNPRKTEQSILRAFESKRASGREFLRVDPDIV
jgi:Meiotically up-regulated gene 113